MYRRFAPVSIIVAAFMMVAATGFSPSAHASPRLGRPLSTTDARARVIVEAQRTADFAGAWVGDDGTINLRFVASGAHASVIDTAKTDGVAVRFGTALFRISELKDVQHKLFSMRADLRALGGQYILTYVDPKLNAVMLVLRARSTQHIRDHLKAMFGSRVQVVEGGATSSAGLPPLMSFTVKGGDWIDDGTWRCSAAFNVDTSSTLYLDSKAHFFTAGHCFTMGTDIENQAGTTVGTVSQRTYDSCLNCPADVEYVNEYYNYLTNVFGLPTNELSNGVRITAVSLGPYTVGQSLCKVGSTSGTTCGTIKQTGVSVCYQAGSCFDGILIVSNDYCHGDSGGPVYYGGTAEGIVSGRTWTTSSEPACGGASGIASTLAGVQAAGYYPQNIDTHN